MIQQKEKKINKKNIYTKMLFYVNLRFSKKVILSHFIFFPAFLDVSLQLISKLRSSFNHDFVAKQTIDHKFSFYNLKSHFPQAENKLDNKIM